MKKTRVTKWTQSVYEEVADIPELMAEQPRAMAIPAQTRAEPWRVKIRYALERRNHEEAVRLLRLKDPTVPLYRRESNLLHYSITNGWLDVTKDLIINHSFKPEYYYYHGEFCLYTAAKGNHIDVVEYLIKERGCDIMMWTHNEFQGCRCVPVLHYVASEGLLDVLRCMVKNINGHIMDEQYRDPANGQNVLHCAIRHIDTMKYLIVECNCNLMVTDNHGQTPFHAASASQGTAEVIEYFLLTGSCDPLAKDNKGITPIQLAIEKQNSSVIAIFKKCGNTKLFHPIDSYVNILLVGNPGAGKSTLSHVINDTATRRSFVRGLFRNVKGVEPCTAGIIPYKLQHRELGNIILHDFAGHSEYYSSHSAVMENLLQGSGGVFLIVVNILEKEAVKQLHQWLTVVRNEAHKALNQCHVIVIVSHVDEISNSVEKKRKEEIQDNIIRESCDSIFLDCRKLGGSGVDSFFKKLSSACESIRSTSGRNLSLYCHMMYGLLKERKENILTLSDVTSAGENNDDYVIPDKIEDVLNALHSLHSTGLINVLQSRDKVWVVVNKGILLTEVDGILFAPKTFKEYVNIASNTGIVRVSGLTRLFPKYDPDMLICFLKNMELFQELSPSFLRMTNLIAEDRDETGDSQIKGERFLFFPCLLSSNRPKEMTSQAYQFGWCLQCTRENDFFLPRYFHVLLLHLAFKMAQPQEGDKLKRRCTFWKNGLYWSNGYGVGSLVEIVDENQCVLVMMSCEKGCNDNMVSLRRDVIEKVMSVYKESCPSLKVKELVIDPKNLAYPVNTPRERTVYSVKDILSAIDKKEEFLVDATSTTRTKLKEILPDESLSSNLSLLGRRYIKEVIEINEIFITATTIKQVVMTIRNLIEILRVLNNGHFQTIKWFDLGLCLGLTYNDLKIIEDNYPRDAKRCLRECLALWLTVDIEATWDKLAIAAGEVGATSAAAYITSGAHNETTEYTDESGNSAQLHHLEAAQKIENIGFIMGKTMESLKAALETKACLNDTTAKLRNPIQGPTEELIEPSLPCLRKTGRDQSEKINGKIASEVLSENIELIQESFKEFEVTKLAEKFMERSIITRDDMEAIVNRKSKKSSRTDRFLMLQLLQELKNTVSLKGEIFSWFIETLKEYDTVESQKMARTLEEQYNKAKP